ncbi:MAG: dioxygenase [SAR324 cluster bacterium]|nr:dioxygenase [SAR324 cluster bacterium]
MSEHSRFPTLYIPHGGGPCFFMEWKMGPPDTWDRMADWLGGLSEQVGRRPEALLIVSAHWETATLKVTGNKQPPLLFDYYGFPDHTYRLEYDAPGSPELAEKICQLLSKSELPCDPDPERGFDHGVFIPLKLIYPDADIPVVCLSLNQSLDPSLHLKVGQSLETLRDQGILIIGSGMSYHNMQGFMKDAELAVSNQFDAWLTEVCEEKFDARNAQLLDWSHGPSARHCHPREEHLLPLMVAAGAAGTDRGSKIFSDQVMGVRVSAFQFGDSLP